MTSPSHPLYGSKVDDPDLRRHLIELRAKIEECVDVGPDPEAVSAQAARRRARNITRLRAKRHRLFGDGLFGEPAWDILLELYFAAFEGRKLSPSSVGLGAKLPQTTLLRWIEKLREGGWLERSADPLDGRRVFVSLSSKAETAMDEFLSEPEFAGFQDGFAYSQ